MIWRHLGADLTDFFILFHFNHGRACQLTVRFCFFIVLLYFKCYTCFVYLYVALL